MKTLRYQHTSIVTGKGSLSKLSIFLQSHTYDRYFIICDEHTSVDCLPVLLFNCEELLSAEIIELESGEAHKTIETCVQTWTVLQELGAGKNSLIINLGGGVITDMGGFIAATFKRGIDFVNIPTTILAMVDASVGGKNGVDLNGAKNQVGTLAQPQLVIADPVFIDTLPERQQWNGIAEIIKIAAISDADFFKTLKTYSSAAAYTHDACIHKAIALKHAIVKKDPTEKHLRKSLNFGHSIGHALESACLELGLDVLHGEAIAAGMIMETYIAHQQKACGKQTLNAIVSIITKHYSPIRISDNMTKRLLEFIRHDKKNDNTGLVFAIAPEIGAFSLMQGVDEQSVVSAIGYYQQI